MSELNWKRSFDKEDEVELDWEKKHIISEKMRDEMESMWEIPQIFHFLQLTKKTLNISHLSMYEVERMLLMPRASKQLANIMTCLLSSPSLKSKLHKLPPMPYDFWTNVLIHKVRSWFKIYENKHKNIIKVFESIGVEFEFWNIFPDISCIEGKDFETLTFKQRVWLLKTLCDTILHNRKTVQEELSKQSWENKIEQILGVDRHGARYIYFPHFLQNDLRVYRHCLDNRILSSVKAPMIKEEPNWEVKDEDTVRLSPLKTGRKKRRKSRWSNGSLPYKGKRRKEREKKRNTEKLTTIVSNDTEVKNNLLTNENKGLSNISSPDKNNELTYDSMVDRIPKCLSEILNENSDETKSAFENENSKGFNSFSENELNQMSLIYDILDEIISTIEKNLTDSKDTTNSSQSITSDEANYSENITNILQSDNFAETTSENETLNQLLPLDVVLECDDFRNSEKSEVNITKQLKVGDNEENEWTSNEKCSNDEVSKLKCQEKGKIPDEDLENDEIGLDKWLSALSRKKDNQGDKESEQKCSKLIKKEKKEKDNKKQVDLKEESFTKDNEAANNTESDNESSLIEIRDSLLNEASFDDFPHAIQNTCSEKYNFQNIKLTESESWDIAANDFKELITDLGASNFKLIADSVETLRNFIEHFSCKDNSLSEINKSIDTFTPVCEINLLSKLSELLKSVESIETALKDCTKKARSKMQKEWINLKDGIVEDKEQTGEDGQSSNWWVIGSQNCMLSPCGTLTEHSDCEYGKRSENQSQKCKSNDEEENKQREQEESDDGDNESEETQEQTKRVLRARGISSYTEQLLSDNSETEELERWTEFEATYTAPNAQINSSTLLPHSQLERSDKRSDPEDSDQDWILPGSRKKRKRQSASRRLKSFQNKLQNIKTSSSSPTPNTSSEVCDEKSTQALVNDSNDKEESRVNISKPPKTSSSATEEVKTPVKENYIKVVPSANMTCKIECTDSVHSELDIKDEGPIMDNAPNNYNMNMQQTHGYVIVKTEPPATANYYVMQPNAPMPGVQQPFMQQTSFVPNAVPPTPIHPSHPGYYVQSAPNFVVHGPHSGYGTPRQMGLQQPQQMIIQQPPQVIGGHQVITHPNYVQYMVNNQQSAVNSSLPRPRMANLNNLRQPYMNSHGQPRGPVMGHQIRMGPMGPQNRLNSPRQPFSHPNGAVIRSMPIAGNGTRFSGARIVTPRNLTPRLNPRAAAPRLPRLPKPNTASSSQNKTSLIVLSDSDDDIEMIVTEKGKSGTKSSPGVSSPRKIVQPNQRQKPVVTSEVTVANSKTTLPPQIMQRMNQGGISITPVKTTPAPTNPNTQLVVVVNETGSHYALALPNGSKLILTPEQVAQIRASNGGKLIL